MKHGALVDTTSVELGGATPLYIAEPARRDECGRGSAGRGRRLDLAVDAARRPCSRRSRATSSKWSAPYCRRRPRRGTHRGPEQRCPIVLGPPGAVAVGRGAGRVDAAAAARGRGELRHARARPGSRPRTSTSRGKRDPRCSAAGVKNEGVRVARTIRKVSCCFASVFLIAGQDGVVARPPTAPDAIDASRSRQPPGSRPEKDPRSEGRLPRRRPRDIPPGRPAPVGPRPVLCGKTSYPTRAARIPWRRQYHPRVEAFPESWASMA